MAMHITVHSSPAVYNLVPLFVHPGGTGTTVTVDAGQGTLNVHTKGRKSTSEADSTITAGSSTTYTPSQAPVFLAVPSGVTSLTISGQGY